MTPYTTKAGVKIGLRYIPPPHRMCHDEEMMQGILLGNHKRRQTSPGSVALLGLLCFCTIVLFVPFK